MFKRIVGCLIAACAFAAPVQAQDFLSESGPVFSEFGRWAPVENMQPVEGQVFKAVFDTSEGAKDGAINWRFDSAARYINLLAHNGVPAEYIHVAIVVHSSASWDVTNDTAYSRKYPGRTNPNREVVAEMLEKGVRFFICGQAAASHGIRNEDLLPGVTMTLSQTVASSVLHNEGFTNIP